jgi:hypothetical protein
MLARLHAAAFLGASRLRTSRQRGTVTVEKLIMIGMIVVPLVILLIIFKDKVSEWYTKTVDSLFKSSEKHDQVTKLGESLDLPVVK